MDALSQYLTELSAYPAMLADLVPALFLGLQAPLPFLAAALLLLLAAAVSLIWYIGTRIWPAHKAIVIASRAIEGIADPVSFAASFPRFDRAINDMPLLRRPWRLFRVGIVIPAQSSRTPVRHHLRAGDYLNVAALEAGGLNFRFFQSWGYFFCGIGFTAGLLGMASEFYLAGNAVAGASPLLSGLAYKLLPLISGLLAGMALLGGFHWSKHRLHKDMQRLSRALEERLQFAPQQQASSSAPSYVAQLAPPKHMPSEEGIHTAPQMQGFSGDLVAALARIESQMTDKLPNRIRDAMQPLSEALDMLGKRLSESNADALRQAVGELSEGLHARAVEDLQALSQALSQARSGLEDVGHVLRDAGSYASEQLSSAGDALVSQISRVSQEAQQAAAPFPVRINEFGDALDQIHAALSRHGDAFAAIVSSAQNAMRAMNEMLTQPRDIQPVHYAAPAALGPMSMLVVEDLSRAARDMSSSAEAVSEARRLLKRLSSRLRQPATALMAGEWEQFSEIADDADELLNEVLNNFREGASDQRAGLETAISEMEERLERLFRDLDSGAVRLESAITTLRRQTPAGPATQDPANNESSGAAA